MTTRTLTTLFALYLVMPLTKAPAAQYTISSHHTGGITIHDYQYQTEEEKLLDDEPLFPFISQMGTGLSLFTTSILYATGYNENRIMSDFGKHLNLEASSLSTGHGMYAGEFLLLLGTLSASIFNYSFGFENDLLAIIPILPVEVSTGGISSTHGLNDMQIRLQFGVYFYFSRDF